jgi:hypothetical protein
MKILPLKRPKPPSVPKPKKVKRKTTRLRLVRTDKDIRIPVIPKEIFYSALKRFTDTIPKFDSWETDYTYIWIVTSTGPYGNPELPYVVVRRTGQVYPIGELSIVFKNPMGNIIDI